MSNSWSTSSEQLPCRSAEVNFSPFFSAKGVVKFGVKFWRHFPCYVFQGLGVRRKISPKFHVKNGVKNGKFHANFTLLGRSAEVTSGQPDFVRAFGGRKTARNRQGKILYTELLKIWSALDQFLANSPSHGKLQGSSLQ